MEVVQELSGPLLVGAIKTERPESLGGAPGDSGLPQPWVLTAGNAGLGIPETITIKEEPCDLAYEIRYANGNGVEDYVVRVADVASENEGVSMLVDGTPDYLETSSPIVLDTDDALGLRIVKTETLAGHAVSWEDGDISGLLDSQEPTSDDRPTSGKKPSPGKCPILRNLLTIPALQGIVVEGDPDETPSETSSNRLTPERSISRTPPALSLAQVADIEKEKDKKKLTRKEVAAKLKTTIQGRQKDKSPVRSPDNAESGNSLSPASKTSSVSPGRRTSPRRPAEVNGPVDAASGSQKTKQGKNAGSKTSNALTKKGNETTSTGETEKTPEKTKTAAQKDAQKGSAENDSDPKTGNESGKETAASDSPTSGTRTTRARAKAMEKKSKKAKEDLKKQPVESPVKVVPHPPDKTEESEKTAPLADNENKSKAVTTTSNKKSKKKKKQNQQEKGPSSSTDSEVVKDSVEKEVVKHSVEKEVVKDAVEKEVPVAPSVVPVKEKARRSKRYALRKQPETENETSSLIALAEESVSEKEPSGEIQNKNTDNEKQDVKQVNADKTSVTHSKKGRVKKRTSSGVNPNVIVAAAPAKKPENLPDHADDAETSVNPPEDPPAEVVPSVSKTLTAEPETPAVETGISTPAVEAIAQEVQNVQQIPPSSGSDDVVEVVSKSVTDQTWIPLVTGYRGRGRGKTRGGKSKTVRQLIEEGRTQLVPTGSIVAQVKEGGVASTVQVSTVNGPSSVVDITGDDPVSDKGRYWTRRGPKTSEGNNTNESVSITKVASLGQETIVSTATLVKTSAPLPIASVNSQMVKQNVNRGSVVDKALRGSDTIAIRPATVTRPAGMVSILKVTTPNPESGLPAGNVFVLDLTESGNPPEQVGANKNSVSSQPRNIMPGLAPGQTLVPVTVTLTRTASGSLVASPASPNILSTAGKKLSPGPVARLSHIVPSLPGIVGPPRGQIVLPRLPAPAHNEPTHMYKIQRDTSGTSVKIVQFPPNSEAGNKESNIPAPSAIANKQTVPQPDSTGNIIGTLYNQDDDDAMSIASSCQSGSDVEDYVCPICSLVFPDASSLGQHVVVHRTFKTKATYQCDRCGARFGRKKDFEKHNAGHKEVSQRIEICRNPSPTDCLLVECLAEGQHEREISKKSQSKRLDAAAESHVQHKGKEQKSSMTDSSALAYSTSAIESGAMKNNENVEGFEKSLNSHQPEEKDSLQDNEQVHVEGQEDIHNLSISEEVQVNVQDVDIEETDPFLDSVPLNVPFTPEFSFAYPKVKYRFLCEACGRRFARLCHLSSHMKVHAGEEDYGCEYCGKAFTNLTSLRLHSKIHEHEELSSEEETADAEVTKVEVEEESNKHVESERKGKPEEQVESSATVAGQSLEMPDTEGTDLNDKHSGKHPDRANIKTWDKNVSKEPKLNDQGYHNPVRNNSPGIRQLKVKTKAMLKQDSFNRDKSAMFGQGFDRWDSHNGPSDVNLPWQNPESKTVESHKPIINSDLGGKVDHTANSDSGVVPNNDLQSPGHDIPTSESIAVAAEPSELLPLQCSVCLQVFTRGCYLTNHRRVHTKEGSIICHVCGNFFKTASSLQAHTQVYHPNTSSDVSSGVPITAKIQYIPNGPSYEGETLSRPPPAVNSTSELSPIHDSRPTVPKALADVNADVPRTSKTFQTVDCDSQPLTTQTVVELESDITSVSKQRATVKKRRQRASSGWRRKRIKCPICLRTFPRRGHLTGHLRTHPPELVKKALGLIDTDGGIEEDSNSEVLDDSIQIQKKLDSNDIDKTILAGGDDTVAKLAEGIHEDQADEELAPEEDKEEVQCAICDRKFSELLDLSNHMRSHFKNDKLSSRDGPDEDEEDHLDSSKSANVTRETTTSATKPHADNGVSEAHELLPGSVLPDAGVTVEPPSGQEAVSAKPQPVAKLPNPLKKKGKFQCVRCGKRYGRLCHLMGHAKGHYNNGFFDCQVCGKGFGSNQNLSDHQKVHMVYTVGGVDTLAEGFNEVVDSVGQNEFLNDVSEGGVPRPDGKRLPYMCSTCGDGFDELGSLKEHMKEHTGNKSWVCSSCGAGFVKATDLAVHKKNSSECKGLPQNKCWTCGLLFTSFEELKSHMTSHQTPDRPHICEVCGAAFKKKPHLLDHVNRHTGARPYACPQCEVTFASSTGMKNHMKKHADSKSVCNVCGAEFIYASGLSVHKRRMHPNESSQQRGDDTSLLEDSPNSSFEENMVHTEELDKPWMCKLCGAEFTRKPHLRDHLKTHTMVTPPKSYDCEECDEKFAQMSELRIHKLTHANKKMYVCSICGSAFPYGSALYVHKKTHKDGKANKCAYCSRTFRVISHLKHHLEVLHGGALAIARGKQRLSPARGRKIIESEKEEQFTIEETNVDRENPPLLPLEVITENVSSEADHQGHLLASGKFQQSLDTYDIDHLDDNSSDDVIPSLSPHDEEHIQEEEDEDDEGTQKLRCTLCRQIFWNEKALKVHMKDHISPEQPHQCDICQKSFTAVNELDEHKKSHKTDRPYQCQSCGAAFYNSSVLKAHISKHSGSKSYQCQQCGQNFSYLCGLWVHNRKVHSTVSVVPVPDKTSAAAESVDKSNKEKMDSQQNTKSSNKDAVQSDSEEETIVSSHKNTFKCEECGIMYHRRDFYANHMKKHAKSAEEPSPHALGDIPVTENAAEPAAEEIPVITAATEEVDQVQPVHVGNKRRKMVRTKRYECSECPAVYQRSDHFATHLKQHAKANRKAAAEQKKQKAKEMASVEVEGTDTSATTMPVLDGAPVEGTVPDKDPKSGIHEGESLAGKHTVEEPTPGDDISNDHQLTPAKATQDIMLPSESINQLDETQAEQPDVPGSSQEESDQADSSAKVSGNKQSIKKYTCPFCDAGYQRPDHFGRHVRRHKGKKKILVAPVKDSALGTSNEDIVKSSSNLGVESGSTEIADSVEQDISGISAATQEQPMVAEEPQSEKPAPTAQQNKDTDVTVPLPVDPLNEDDNVDIQSRLESELELLMAPPGKKVYSCPECPNQYKRKDHFASHLQKQHLDQETNLSKKQLMTDILHRLGVTKKHESGDDAQEKKIYKCMACTSKYHRKDHFANHLKKHLESLQKGSKASDKSKRPTGESSSKLQDIGDSNKIDKLPAAASEKVGEAKEVGEENDAGDALEDEVDDQDTQDDCEETLDVDKEQILNRDQLLESEQSVADVITDEPEVHKKEKVAVSSKRSKSSEKEKGDKEKAGKLYVCPECHVEYHRRDHFASHLKKHQAEVHKKLGLSAPNCFTKMIEELRNPARVVAHKFVCPHCSSEYQRRDHFETHLKRHLETDSKDSLKGPRKWKSRQGSRKSVQGLTVVQPETSVKPVGPAEEEIPSIPQDIFANRRPEEEEAVRTIISLQMEAQQRNPVVESTYSSSSGFGTMSEPLDPRECESAVANLLALQNAFVQPSPKPTSASSASRSSPQSLTPLEPVEPTVSTYSLSGSRTVEIRPPGSMPSLTAASGGPEVPLEEPELMSSTEESSEEEEESKSSKTPVTSEKRKESEQIIKQSASTVQKRKEGQPGEKNIAQQPIKSSAPKIVDETDSGETTVHSGSGYRLHVEEEPAVSRDEEVDETVGEERDDPPVLTTEDYNKDDISKKDDVTVTESSDEHEKPSETAEDHGKIKIQPVSKKSKNDPKRKTDPKSGKARKSYTCDICGSVYHRRDYFVAHMSKHDAPPKLSEKKSTSHDKGSKEKSLKTDKNPVADTSDHAAPADQAANSAKSLATAVDHSFDNVTEPAGTNKGGQSQEEQEPSAVESQDDLNEDLETQPSASDEVSEKKSGKTLKGKDRKSYTCEQCSAEYARIDHFSSHMKTKHPGIKWKEPVSAPKTYNCSECGAVYQRSDHFAHHMKSKHPGVVTEEIVPVVKATPPPHKVYKCTACAAEYQRRDHFITHMKSKHPGVSYDIGPPKVSGPKVYMCPECGAEYHRSDHFATHMKNKHPDTSQEGASQKTSSGRTVRPRLQSESQKSTVSDSQDTAALNTSDGGQQEETQEGVSDQVDTSMSELADKSQEDDVGQDNVTGDDDVYRCHHCGAEYQRKYHFINHMKKHRKDLPIARGEKRTSTNYDTQTTRKKPSIHTIEQLNEFVDRIVGVGHKVRDETEAASSAQKNVDVDQGDLADTAFTGDDQQDMPPQYLHSSSSRETVAKDKYTNQSNPLGFNSSPNSPRYSDAEQSGKLKSVHRKIYRCPKCGAEYQRKDHFDSHMKKHGDSVSKYSLASPGSNRDPCESLDICSPVSMALSVDSDQPERNNQDLEPDELHGGKTPSKGSGRMEKPSSSRKEYKCPDCDAIYHRKDHFATHMMKHERRKANKCSECGMEFESPKGLRIHLKVKHDQRRLHNDGGVNDDQKNRKRKRADEEDTSSDLTKDAQELDNHAGHHSDLEKNSEQVSTHEIKCPNCDEPFSTRLELDEHITNHRCDKDNPYKCAECKTTFKRKPQYDDHMRRHRGEKPYECAECGAGFTSAAALRVHANKHSKVKSFVCNLCGAAFKFYTGLFRHKKLHKSDTGFKCHKCHLDFTDEEALKQHVSEEHPEQQRSLTCETCGKYFRSEDKMRKHELEHQREEHDEPEESVEDETEGEEEDQIARGSPRQRSHPEAMDARQPIGDSGQLPVADGQIRHNQLMRGDQESGNHYMEECLEGSSDPEAGDKFHHPSHVLKYRWNLAQFSRNMRAQSTGGVIQSTIEAARKDPGQSDGDDADVGSAWTPDPSSEQEQMRMRSSDGSIQQDSLRTGGYSEHTSKSVQRSLSEPLGAGPLLPQGPAEKPRHSTGNVPDPGTQGSSLGLQNAGSRDDSRPGSASQGSSRSSKDDKSGSYPAVRPHPRVYKCEVCDIEIDDRQAFKLHMAVHVAAHTRTNLSPETSFREGSPVTEPERTYPRCDQCGRQCANDRELEEHRQTHRQESQPQRSSSYWGQHQMEQTPVECSLPVGMPPSRSSLEHAIDHSLGKHMERPYDRMTLEPLPSQMDQSLGHPQLEHQAMGRPRLDYPPMNYPPPYLSGFPQHSSTGYWEPVPMDYRDPSCLGYPERPPPDYHQATRGYPEPPMPPRSLSSGMMSPGSMPPSSMPPSSMPPVSMSSSAMSSNQLRPMSSPSMASVSSNSLTSMPPSSMPIVSMSGGSLPSSSMAPGSVTNMPQRSMVHGSLPLTPNRDGQDRLRGDYSDVSAADLADEEDLNVDSNSDCEGLHVSAMTSSPKRKRSRSSETDVQQYKCPKCDTTCKTKGELVKHKRVHTIRNFKCPTCGESFTSNHYLKIHMRWHSGTRPFPCEHCDAAFVTQAGLQVHMAKHSGERRYVCSECGAAFKYYSNLYAHKQKHT